MDLVTFFRRQHAAVHASDVSGHVFQSQRIFGELSDDQMRMRPGTGLNSLIWLLWHMARTEDTVVNSVVAGGSGPRRRVDASHERAVAHHRDRDDRRRGRRDDCARRHRVRAGGWTRGDQLASSALRHNAAHIGEAVTILGLAGFPLGI